MRRSKPTRQAASPVVQPPCGQGRWGPATPDMCFSKGWHRGRAASSANSGSAGGNSPFGLQQTSQHGSESVQMASGRSQDSVCVLTFVDPHSTMHRRDAAVRTVCRPKCACGENRKGYSGALHLVSVQGWTLLGTMDTLHHLVRRTCAQRFHGVGRRQRCQRQGVLHTCMGCRTCTQRHDSL